MIAVISDVHGNLKALKAVLRDIRRRGIKAIYFLGDAVGYGPEPDECVSLINASCGVKLAGNHDWAVLGLTDITYFNAAARAAILWTERGLSRESREAMGSWPLVKVIKRPEALLVHSSPESPEDWHYLIDGGDIVRAFGFFRERSCLVGHSHWPFMAERLPSSEVLLHREKVTFKKGARYVINVGSVGQPRDGDPRACYALFHGRGAELVRVRYPVGETQRRMRDEGLPEPLIQRLSLGR
jgi:diadenosine tetraphosphatase ApaH/serine/threonine PP2A family protein phosphatase